MADLNTPENPAWVPVYQLEVEDPVAGGPDGIDNRPHKELAERTEFLKVEADKVRADVDSQNERLGQVEGSSSIAVSKAQLLAWAESDEGYSFEMFGDVIHTMRSFSAVAVTKTVNGDDSVDVESTADIRVGSSYVVFDDNGAETVVVSEILTPTRFKATENLSVTRSAGSLDRTNWNIQSGHAIAPEDGFFYTKPLSTLRYWNDGVFVIRRDTGDGVAAISARQIDSNNWLPAEFLESKQETAGTRDERYRIPVGGKIEVKIETSGGSINFEHLMLLTSPQAGRADPVAKPVNFTPAAGAVNVMDPTTFTGSAPRSLYGDAMASATIFVYSDPEGKNLVHTGTVENPTGNLSYTAPGCTLVENGSGSWQFFYTDINGNVSRRSDLTGFSASAVFQFTKAPVIIAPAAESEIMQSDVTIVTAAMQVEPGGVGEHIASQYKITSDVAGLIEVYNSGEVTDLTAHLMGATIERGKDFYVWARHKDATRGWSDYCAPVKFHIAEIAPGVRVDGGIVAGLMTFADGKKGWLIFAPASQRITTEWGFYGVNTGIPDTLSCTTAGIANTAIIAGGSPAASHCANLNFEGCTDFFLPSMTEAQYGCAQKNLIDAADDTVGTTLGQLGYAYSWVSNELDATNAYLVCVGNSVAGSGDKRAIRWVLPARRILI